MYEFFGHEAAFVASDERMARRDMERVREARFATLDGMSRRQKAIVEPDGDGGVLIMHETGEVEYAKDAETAARKIRARARKGNPGATITTIEWRGVTPPEED